MVVGYKAKYFPKTVRCPQAFDGPIDMFQVTITTSYSLFVTLHPYPP